MGKPQFNYSDIHGSLDLFIPIIQELNDNYNRKLAPYSFPNWSWNISEIHASIRDEDNVKACNVIMDNNSNTTFGSKEFHFTTAVIKQN